MLPLPLIMSEARESGLEGWPGGVGGGGREKDVRENSLLRKRKQVL